MLFYMLIERIQLIKVKEKLLINLFNNLNKALKIMLTLILILFDIYLKLERI